MGTIILIAILMLAALLCFRAATVKKLPLPEISETVLADIDVDATAGRLSSAIQKPTVSHTDPSKVDWQPFREFIALLEKNYPRFHQAGEREFVNDYGMIFHIRGRDSDLKPVLMIGHYDVVPVEKSTEDQWEQPPFGGVIADGFVWGRGTMDMKLHTISPLEALELLLSDGFTPERDLYLAFGQDEEVSGKMGAAAISRLLKERGMAFDFVLDEGGGVIQGAFPMLKKPMATIGIAEKGITSIRITVEGTGGHASMPPKHTAVGILSQIITSLERQQFDLRISETVKQQFERIGMELPFHLRLLTANLWFFGPVFKRIMSRTTVGNAMMRTTTAATMAEGSQAHNVLPPRASAVVNFRLLHGETLSDVMEHIRKVASPVKVELEPLFGNDPSNVSPTDSQGFKLIEQTIHEVFPGVLVSPYLVMGATDARQYEVVSPNVYRFSPMLIDQSDLDRIHNVNERISFENVKRSVQFFHRLISQL